MQVEIPRFARDGKRSINGLFHDTFGLEERKKRTTCQNRGRLRIGRIRIFRATSEHACGVGVVPTWAPALLRMTLPSQARGGSLEAKGCRRLPDWNAAQTKTGIRWEFLDRTQAEWLISRAAVCKLDSVSIFRSKTGVKVINCCACSAYARRWTPVGRCPAGLQEG